MTPGAAPYADGNFVGSPIEQPPQGGPVERLAPLVPIQAGTHFDPDGRRQRREARREALRYGHPKTEHEPVDPEVAVGKERQPWGDIETWIRKQANPRLRGNPTVSQWFETARALHAVATWVEDNAQTLHDQLAQAGKGYSTTSRPQEGARGATAGIPTTSVERAVLGHVEDSDDDNVPGDRLAPPDIDEDMVTVGRILFGTGAVASGCQRRLGSSMARRAEERPYMDDQPPLGDCPGLEDHEECTCRPDWGGAGHCMACGEWCSGQRNDRVVSGLCEKACRSAMRRWLERGQPDPSRVAFIAWRRDFLAQRAAEAAAVVHEDELADRRARRARDKGRRAA